MNECPVSGATSFSLADPAAVANPYPFYERLREQQGIHFDEKMGMYVATRHEDIMAVLRDHVTFSQERAWKQHFGHQYPDELRERLIRDGGGFFTDVLQSDPPLHTRIRALLEQAFAMRRVVSLEPRIRAIIEKRVEAIADKGAIDGMHDLAVPLTNEIMCEQLGFPGEAAHRISAWGRAYIAQLHAHQTPEQFDANVKLICELQHFIIDRIREREAEPREDMISDLVHARLEDGSTGLSFEEVVALTRGALIAGNDTTSRAITNFFYVIATKPEVAAHLDTIIDDDKALGRFVEELLRYSPPVRALFRYVTADTEVAGTPIAAGNFIMMAFASGNDDEAVFECPRHFDPKRDNVIRHVAFGGGIHLCAGIALARMEIRTTLRAVMKRMKDIRLAVPIEEVPVAATASYRAFDGLPITFSRR
jgi:cytochrome P450